MTVVFLIKLIADLTKRRKPALISGYILAILPWHVHFGRAGFEANLSLFFITAGTYFLFSFSQRKINLLLSFILLTLAFYTYFAARIFLPLLLISLFIKDKKKLKKIILFLILPFILFSLSSQGLVRPSTVLFTREVKANPDTFFTNKIFLFNEQFAKNYFKYFSLDFLFFSGDGNGRHGVKEIGGIYLWLLPFLLLGIHRGIKEKKFADKIFFIWFLVTPIAGALSIPSPHTLRSLYMVVPIAYFSASGMSRLNLDKRLLSCSICFIVIYFLFQYLHIYYVHYPKRTSPDWSGGYRQAIEYAVEREDKYDKIFITDKMTLGYIYLYYYGREDPAEVLKSPAPQKGFEKFKFVSSPFNQKIEGKVLYLGPYWEDWYGKKLAEVKNQGNDLVFTIWEN